MEAIVPNNTSLLMHPQDLFLAVPRMLARAGSFAFITVPEKIDHMLGLGHGGSMIAEATGNGSRNIISAAFSGSSSAADVVSASAGGAGTGSAPGIAAMTGSAGLGPFGPIGSFQQVRSFGGILSYMTSKWAIACCTLAVVLNRTHLYASARRRVNATWQVRLLMRLVPILLFMYHAHTLAQAIRCQTSEKYTFLKYGKTGPTEELDFAGGGGALHQITSAFLFWEDDTQSCLAADMIPSDSLPWTQRGSFSLLWPFFQSLCFGQFIETLSCALQGRDLKTETGMSIFEHSLAFAEAEGILSIGLDLPAFASSATRAALLYRLNTPPEVLLLALISALNNLSSQILGVMNKQHKFRLLNTGVWGLCFMSAFMWGFLNLGPESGPEHLILRIPTVCIVGFIPHLLVLLGMGTCALIYCLALFLSFLSPPVDGSRSLSWRERFAAARENMQANSQIANIQINMHEDFYSALIRIGFSALTVASEAVYLNEGRAISVAPLTWIEEDRLKEFDELHDFNDPTQSLAVQIEEVNNAGQQSRKWTSGYALQTTFKADKLGSTSNVQRADGVGHLQRGGRYFLVYEYFEGIFWLLLGWSKVCCIKILDKTGVVRRPSWLRHSREKQGLESRLAFDQSTGSGTRTLDFWMLSEEGVLSLPDDNNVDVAEETRKRLALANGWQGEKPGDEEKLDDALYDWWKSNGWWGERDESGSYAPSQIDEGGSEVADDTTSVWSMSTSASVVDDVEQQSGRTTPTQETYALSHHHLHHTSSTSGSKTTLVDHNLDPEHLASLLNPVTPAARQEAQMLSHHLLSDRITTRSLYAHARSTQASKLLTSTRLRPPNSKIPTDGPLTPSEEAQLLEQLVLSRRSSKSPASPSGTINSPSLPSAAQSTWRTGGEGAGSGGPQCVVCQSSPRTVLAWPCRCLSLCEDCRVSLAINNFATCVCCRRDVVGFSRLYVP